MKFFQLKKAELEKKKVYVKIKCRTYPISEDGEKNFKNAFKNYEDPFATPAYFELDYYYPKEFINEHQMKQRIEQAGQDSIKGYVVGAGRSKQGSEAFNIALLGRTLKSPLVFKEDYDVEVLEIIEYQDNEKQLDWSHIKAVK